MTRFATQHALFWLMVGNGIGLWLSILLLFPELNSLIGEFSYGRLLPLHLNFQLYGWTSVPLVAWLFKLYPSTRPEDGTIARAAILTWSLSLGAGALSWLLGINSGKIFLEWQGFSRVLFAFTLLFLWCALALRFWNGGRADRWMSAGKAVGLLALGAVVPVWYWSGSPGVYPSVNPQTSGTTAASLLGSTLSVILLLLIAAPSLGKLRCSRSTAKICWAVFALEVVLFLAADKSNQSHRSVSQAALLGALLVWVPLLPMYYRAFQFNGSRKSPVSFLAWFALLTVTGWLSFLPQILEGWKFTNALVAHSHLAMAGFVTTFNLFLLQCLQGQGAALTISPASFRAWNLATLTFIALMWMAGTLEARDPAFTILPNAPRTAIYLGRTLCGAAMLACATLWWRASFVSKLPLPADSSLDPVAPEALVAT